MVAMHTGNNTSAATLTVVGLTKSYGDRRVVDGLSFSVGVGETLGLLGPNGSGKTTTISMIAGVLAADSGSITIAGEPMSAAAKQAKRQVGLVPQDIALYDDLTAVENLRFFGRLHGLGRRQLNQRIDDVLEIVGLSDRRNDRVGEYSGGMQRRANIAAGMLHEPTLLILDEPTVGVDPQSRNQILDAVAELGGSGLSVIYTTHYMEEAERLCDRVCIIDGGQLLATGTQAELLAADNEGAKNLEEVFLHLTGRRVRD